MLFLGLQVINIWSANFHARCYQSYIESSSPPVRLQMKLLQQL